MTVASLQALAKVYKRYHEEIGQFSDMSYILQLLDRVNITYFHFEIRDDSLNIFLSHFSVCRHHCAMLWSVW